MLRITVFAFTILTATSTLCQELSLSKFGFQDVLLNMPFSSIPPAYKGDCSSSSDKRSVLCMHKAQAGTVPMTVEIFVFDERVVEIQAYFPDQEFDTVWSALRKKYGKEDKWDASKVEWYTNPLGLDKPIPDELALYRKPKELPTPYGTYFMPNVEYSVIQYESAAAARDAGRKRSEEREHKVKGVADKL